MCQPSANYIVVVENTVDVVGRYGTYGLARKAAEVAAADYVSNSGEGANVVIYQAAAVIGERRTVDVLWTPTASVGVI